jgi:hypothetical protein
MVMESALSDAARCMREPYCRGGQDCSDAIGLPASGRPWTTADGRDYQFKVDADSGHSTCRGLNG